MTKHDLVEDDFYACATEGVQNFFRSFTYPSRTEFTEDEISHVIDIVASVFMTRLEYRIGGSFVNAIVDNNLSQAFSRADSTILKALRVIVYCNENTPLRKFKPAFETINQG